jgi:hypothetical protein
MLREHLKIMNNAYQCDRFKRTILGESKIVQQRINKWFTQIVAII